MNKERNKVRRWINMFIMNFLLYYIRILKITRYHPISLLLWKVCYYTHIHYSILGRTINPRVDHILKLYTLYI